MKYISPLITDARNKLGGSVFARNRSGVYARARVSPVQPRTPFQQANRATFAALSSGWRALTASQRSGWNTYASGLTLHDTLGAAYKPSGMQAFISFSRNAILVGGTQVDNAPVNQPAEPAFSIDSLTLINNGGGWDTFDAFIQPYGSGSPHMLLFAFTGPLSPGVTFIGKSLYRTLGYDTNDLGDYNYQDAYSAQFGIPPTGSLVGMRVRQINRVTGISTLWLNTTTIVG